MTIPAPPAVTCERCKGTGFWETGPHSGECSDCRGTGKARTPPPDRIPEPSEADILKLCDELDQESREADERNEGTYRTKMPIQTETLRILTALVRRCHAAERAILERDLLSSRARAAEAERDEDRIRVLALEAQVFKMAEWLLTEKRIAEETIAEDEVPDMMTDAYRQRIAEIAALLDGSAGASHLADLSASRKAAEADAGRLRVERNELARICGCLEPGENGQPSCDPPCIACAALAGR